MPNTMKRNESLTTAVTLPSTARQTAEPAAQTFKDRLAAFTAAVENLPILRPRYIWLDVLVLGVFLLR